MAAAVVDVVAVELCQSIQRCIRDSSESVFAIHHLGFLNFHESTSPSINLFVDVVYVYD